MRTLSAERIELIDALVAEANLVLLPLVYGERKYAFDEAFGSFSNIARRLIGVLK